jgi:outer membrane protein insertion porin family/translocation and assembly module TamA
MRHRSWVARAFLAVSLLATVGCKEEQGGVQVDELSFEGIHAVTEKQLKSVLATGESAWLPWGTKRYFSREQFEADLKRIEAFYADRGFPDARVKSFDVQLNEPQTSVKVSIVIDEGEPLRVERVVLDGFDPLPDEHERTLVTRLPLKDGQPLDRALLQASREAALDELRDHGHPYASVRLEESPGSAPRRSVITLRADAGPLAHFGEIEINGNSSVSDSIIRRQLWFRPGQLFEQNKLRESQRRLYGLELFQFANVEPVGLDERSPTIATRVTVTEGKHRRVNFSVGYGSEEKARAEVDWRHVNFFGGARTAGVLARYSSLDRGVRLNFDQPYVFSRFYSFGLTGQSWFTDEALYDLTTLGGRATLTRQFRRGGGPVLGGLRPATTLSFTYVNEWQDYTISNEALNDETIRDDLILLGLDPTGLDDGDAGRGRGQLSSLMIDFGRNTTGNILDARRGYFAAFHLEQAGRWMQGDFDFYELTAEGRYYLSLGDRAVFAVRGRAGSIDAWGPEVSRVPLFKRYFLGGATSLRGWGRMEVAPLSGSGLPIGGHTFALVSTELRMPVWGNLGAVAFLDAGNVWSRPWDFNLNDVRYSVGPGLRYNTRIGPIRADLGYQLNPIDGLRVNGEPQPRRFRFHFSIGHAF